MTNNFKLTFLIGLWSNPYRRFPLWSFGSITRSEKVWKFHSYFERTIENDQSTVIHLWVWFPLKPFNYTISVLTGNTFLSFLHLDRLYDIIYFKYLLKFTVHHNSKKFQLCERYYYLGHWFYFIIKQIKFHPFQYNFLI